MARPTRILAMCSDSNFPSSTAGLTPGTMIADKFRVERQLGEGGMGVVYAATNVSTNRAVALKVMHAEYASKKDVVRRFIREAKAATAIKHPNVIDVLDVVTGESGEPVMVMELLMGEPLDALLTRRGVLPLGEVAALMLPVAAAVGTAHAHGIIHRDLKPENIYLVRRTDGSVIPKVLDFGIAKVLDPARINEETTKSGVTRTGSMLGTPHYMSVEQACGEKDIDHRTDIWSIGVMLYVMLTGRRPYAGDNFGQILKSLVTETPPRIETLVPGLPSEVANIVHRCIDRNREGRPQSLRELHEVLSKYSGDTTVLAPPSLRGGAPVADLASSATLAASSLYASVPDAQKPRAARSKRAVGMVAAGLVVVAAGSIGAWRIAVGGHVRSDRAAEPPPSAVPAVQPTVVASASRASIVELADTDAQAESDASPGATVRTPSGPASHPVAGAASSAPIAARAKETAAPVTGAPPASGEAHKKPGIITQSPY